MLPRKVAMEAKVPVPETDTGSQVENKKKGIED